MKRKVGVTERVVKAAREAFLEHGYQGASIRDIADEAQTSPRAIYTRFENKEDLFVSLVSSVAEHIRDMVMLNESIFYEDVKKYGLTKYSEVNPYYSDILKYCYKHKEEVTLLLTKSQGTKYEHLIEDLVKIKIEHRKNELDGLQFVSNKKTNRGIAINVLLHGLTTEFFEKLFYPIVYDVSLDVGLNYVNSLLDFYSGGVSRLVECNLEINKKNTSK